MRKASAYILAMVILTQTFYNLGVIGYWYADHSYIVQYLCENRDKPEMKCDGKCYLRKKMAPETPVNSTSNQKMPELVKGLDLAEVVEYSFPELRSPSNFGPEVSFYVPVGRVMDFAADIFHPPAIG
jgi:hypothetical protein